MNSKREYVINEFTVLLTGEYDEYGNLCSRVIEGDKSFLVTMTPIDILNKTLLQQGCTFHGALESAKYALGSMKMVPIRVHPKFDIMMFPTKSYKQANCVWFALSHIRSAKPTGVRKTEVRTNFGHTITMNMKQSSFNNKRQIAEDLLEYFAKDLGDSSSVSDGRKLGFCMYEHQTKYKPELKIRPFHQPIQDLEE